MSEKEYIKIQKETLQKIEDVIFNVHIELMQPIITPGKRNTIELLLDCSDRLTDIGLEILDILEPEKTL